RCARRGRRRGPAPAGSRCRGRRRSGSRRPRPAAPRPRTRRRCPAAGRTRWTAGRCRGPRGPRPRPGYRRWWPPTPAPRPPVRRSRRRPGWRRSSGLPPLNRHAHPRAVLGPGAVVVLHVRLLQDLVQHEPGVRGALTDPAVGDGVLAEVQPGLVLVELGEVVVGLERAVLVGRLGPGDVLGGGDVPAALSLLLRQVGRGQQPAGELVRRADVDQIALVDRRPHLIALYTQRPFVV